MATPTATPVDAGHDETGDDAQEGDRQMIKQRAVQQHRNQVFQDDARRRQEDRRHAFDAHHDFPRQKHRHAALATAGLRRAPGPDLQLEYPVALAADGKLVQGYVDLLGVRDGRLAVVDFKTDAPPADDVHATHAAYVEQVRSYARILEELGLAVPGTVSAGLLFTAEQEIRWVQR